MKPARELRRESHAADLSGIDETPAKVMALELDTSTWRGEPLAVVLARVDEP